MDKLSTKHRTFVLHYLATLNPAEAAGEAGFPRNKGTALLRRKDIAEAISEAQKAREERLELTADRVLRELCDIGFLDIADLAEIGAGSGPQDLADLPEKVRRAIIGWSWDKSGNFTVKTADKLAALDKLARHLELYSGRGEGGQVVINIGGKDADL